MHNADNRVSDYANQDKLCDTCSHHANEMVVNKPYVSQEDWFALVDVLTRDLDSMKSRCSPVDGAQSLPLRCRTDIRRCRRCL